MHYKNDMKCRVKYSYQCVNAMTHSVDLSYKCDGDNWDFIWLDCFKSISRFATMDMVNTSGRNSTSSEAERIVKEMNSLDLSILGLTTRIEENYKSQELLDQETKEIMKQLEALDQLTPSSEPSLSPTEKYADLDGIEPMEWEAFDAIPDSPIDSESLCSNQEDANFANSVTSFKNGSILDPTDPFCDPREIRFMQEYWKSSNDNIKDNPNPSIDEFKNSKVSEVHEEVMDLLRSIRTHSEQADQELGDRYNHQKRSFLQLNSDTPFGQSNDPTVRYGSSEYEEWKSIVHLWGEEFLYGMLDQIPDQIPLIKELPTTKHFIDTSRLVTNPEEALIEHFESTPWSEDEKKIFMEKFIEHPKDFHQISKFLPYRTTGDCVQFFYTNKKLDEFGNVRRKQQLKKRRLQSESNKEAYSQIMTLRMLSNKPQQLLTEQQKKRELRSWILNRIEKQEISFTDQDLINAVRRHGLNYKEVAEEVGCQEASFIGSYLLIHRRRLGLEEFFQMKPMMHPCPMNNMRRVESEQLTSLRSDHRLLQGVEITRRGSDQFPVNRNGIEELSAKMPSYLMNTCEQNDQMKAMLQKLPHYAFHAPSSSKDCKQS